MRRPLGRRVSVPLAVLAAVCLAASTASASGRGAAPGVATDETALPYAGPVAESAVAVSPRDPSTVVVAAIGFGAHTFADAAQYGYQPDDHIWRSTDAGRTFREAGSLPFIAPVTASGSDDPTLAWDPHGPLYAAYLVNVDNTGSPNDTHDGLWVARSWDGGLHWTGALAAANVYTGHGCTGPDRPTVTVDPRNGTVWVAYQHLVFTSTPCASAATTDVRLVRSVDGGRTWSKPLVVAADPANPPSGAVPAALPGGGVAVAFLQPVALALPARHCGYYSSVRMATVTRDLKVSPSRVLVDEVCGGPSGTAAPTSFQTVPNMPTVAVDPQTGVVAVAVGNAAPTGASIVVALTSRSGSVRRQTVGVEPGSTPAMPQLAAGAGRFALSYLADLPGGVYRPRLISSADQGQHWSDPVELASQPSAGDARPQALFLDPFSIGHYQGLAIGSDRVAHAAWPDLRPSADPQATRTFVRGVVLP